MRIPGPPERPQVGKAYPQSTDGPTTRKSDKAGRSTGSVLKEILMAATLLAPVAPPTILRGFEPPTSTYGRGHRGADYVAAPGQRVRSPIAGVVTFAGRVNDRSLATISNGSLQVSLEPLNPTVHVGDVVAAGDVIGSVGSGGHCSMQCIHVGVRVDGVYVDPQMSRRRLLPY